jgi:hypothetical protein
MADPTSTRAEVLASDALRETPEVVWQDDVHLGYRKAVKSVLIFLLNQAAGRGYAGMWSDHLGFLLDVQSSIERAAPVDAALERLERGLQALAESVDRAAQQIAQLPTVPPGGFALLILAPAIRADPELAAEYNLTLQEWEEAARVATEHAREMGDTATRFQTETPVRIGALREAVQKAKADNVLDDVLRARYLQRLDLLELAVTRRVLPAVQKAERAGQHAHARWTAARNVERFR